MKTMPIRSTVALLGMLACSVVLSDDEPAELLPLLDAGASLNTYAQADLNGDGLADYVFVEEMPDAAYVVDKDNESDQPPLLRTLKIAVRDSQGGLQVVKRNSRIVYSSDAGGMMGDPFQEGLQAQEKMFTVSNAGGSAWRWANTFEFRYSRKDDTWQLVLVEESSYHVMAENPEEGEEQVQRFTPPKDFGKIDIADFDPDTFKGAGLR